MESKVLYISEISNRCYQYCCFG